MHAPAPQNPEHDHRSRPDPPSVKAAIPSPLRIFPMPPDSSSAIRDRWKSPIPQRGTNRSMWGSSTSKGRLQVYRGWRDQWQPYQIPNPPAANPAGLIPGAPLSLVSQNGQQPPLAYTVNSGGKLVEIANGNQIRPVAEDLQFASRIPSSTPARTAPGRMALPWTKQGRLWNLDLARGRHQLIDRHAGRFTSGVPISVVSHSTNRGPATRTCTSWIARDSF